MAAAAAGPIIGGAIGGAGALAGGKAASEGISHAADLQAAANEKALEFAKERYTRLQTNQAPYMQAGVAASGGIGDLLARAAQRSGYSYSQPPMPTAGQP